MTRAQRLVAAYHYLRRPVDPRSTPEGYEVCTAAGALGVMIVGRPEATRCYPWYGSVDDVESGRAEVSRWQVLNLARVWIAPEAQPGGAVHQASGLRSRSGQPPLLPGFLDRRGHWRSTLASTAIAALADVVVADYLLRRPPCFLEEPYQLRWLLSYCDTRLHRGALYRAAGFELHRMNAAGVQTWRRPLRALTAAEDAAVRDAARRSPRSIMHRERRAQAVLFS